MQSIEHCFWPSILKMQCLREPEASWFIPGSWRWVIYSWWGMKRLHIAEPAANGGIARGRWSNWGMGRGSCWPVYSPGVSQYSGHVWSWVRMTDNPKKKKKKFKIIFYFFFFPPKMLAFGSLSLHNVMVVSAALLPPARGTGDEVLLDAGLYILLNPSRTSYLLF